MGRFWNLPRCFAAALALGTVAGAQGQYQLAKLAAGDGAPGDWFGCTVNSISMEGDVLAIGAPLDHDDSGRSRGSAYLFARTNRGWGEIAKLIPDGAVYDDWYRFGDGVSLSGSTLIVGAYGDDALADWAGAAYVFEQEDGVWTQTAKLTASDGGTYDQFGADVSLEGDTAVIGSYYSPGGGYEGAAYVFQRVDGEWLEVAKLLGSDYPSDSAFGGSVIVDSGRLLIGAPWAPPAGGAAFVFEQIGGAWSQTAKLTSGSPDQDEFGTCVSLSGDAAIIGAPWASVPWFNPGAAYIYEQAGDTWTQAVRIDDADPEEGGYFGKAVSMDGETAVIGVDSDDDLGQNSGSVIVYRRTGGQWEFLAKLLASDGSADQRLGCSVQIAGDLVLAGAAGEDECGAVYIFDLGPCRADFNADYDVDTRDVLAFLNAWASGDTRADWDQNGTIDTQDVLAFLSDWAAGC